MHRLWRLNLGMVMAGVVLGLGNTIAAGLPADAPKPYIRVAHPDANTVRLETAVRKFARPGGGPVIWLAGVTHVGDAAYYAKLQAHLDGVSRVLYEGVGHPDFLEPEPPATEQECIARTDSLLDYLEETAAWYRATKGQWPDSLDALLSAIREGRGREKPWTRSADRDAWKHPIRIVAQESGCLIVSLGADGREGGEGANADRTRALTGAGKAGDKGDMQSSLAEALGLVFQLHAIDYDRPHFRNSDMSLEEMKTALRKGDDGKGNSEQLDSMMSMMSGDSFISKVFIVVLKLIGANPHMQALLKTVMVESLANADDMLSAENSPMAGLMTVLLHDRNEKVMNDLRRLLADPDCPSSVSLFYGAAHMTGMEATLVKELGYRPAGEEWYPAFGVDAQAAGVSEGELNFIRGIVAMQREQLKQMQAQSKPAPSTPPKPPEAAAPSAP